MEQANQSARRELVRCCCGVPRGSSDDPPLQLPTRAAEIIAEMLGRLVGGEPTHLPLLEQFEPPRICRACGAIYMMPRQVESAAH